MHDAFRAACSDGTAPEGHQERGETKPLANLLRVLSSRSAIHYFNTNVTPFQKAGIGRTVSNF